jgi:predicted dehydrogenase
VRTLNSRLKGNGRIEESHDPALEDMSLKAVIVGAGMAGSQLHLTAYHRVAGIEAIAICDRDLEKAKHVAGQNGIPYAFSSLDEALSSLPADIVSVCTPPSSHYELCRLALERGCHVLMEKPIFQTLDEAYEIRRIISHTTCRFSAVHNQKYQRGIQQALKLVKEGVIGDIVQIHVARMIDGSTERLAADPGSWCHKLPGGRWEELIAHPLYKAYQFMGPMRFVDLKMKQVCNRQPWLPSDELEIILEGAAGYVSIKLSANAGNYGFMIVYGSKKYLYVDSEVAIDPMSMAYYVNYRPSFRKWLRQGLRLAAGSRAMSWEQDPHAELIKEFIACIRGERPGPPVDWQEALNTLDLGLRIGREIRQRRSNIATASRGPA